MCFKTSSKACSASGLFPGSAWGLKSEGGNLAGAGKRLLEVSKEGVLAAVDLYRVKKLWMEAAMVCRFRDSGRVGKSGKDDVTHD